MGFTQLILSTLAFAAFELPPNGAVGTEILEFLFHSRPDLVNIRSIDEAVVIAAALSLSSSAFVLQDIDVVPLLVILPILESQDDDPCIRKIAAICVAKLYDINAELVEDWGLLDSLKDLISDNNPMVVANAIAALAEIQEHSSKPIFEITSHTLSKLPTALNECTEIIFGSLMKNRMVLSRSASK